MKKINKEYIIFAIVLLIVAIGGSFFGGMKYQEGKIGARFGQMQNGQMQNGQKGGTGISMTRQKGGLIGGEILSMDEKSITLKDRSGGSRIVFFSGSTQYLKSISGTVQDIGVGSNITVTGDQNSDGSVTAKIIQISSQAVPSNTNVEKSIGK